MTAVTSSPKTLSSDYARIETAIRYIAERFRDQPSLAELAAHTGLSPYHFQRLFRRWAGVSPKRFLQYLTADYAADALRRSRGVLDAALDSGLSGGGRLHDLLVNLHAVTPGELGARGAGLTIRYGFHATPFGECLIGVTERGICALSFAGNTDDLLAELADAWPKARLQQHPGTTAPVARRLFQRPRRRGAIPLYVQGTNFQIKVWEALLRISPGSVATYTDVAHAVGAPRAVRAVANAIGANPVALLIPCHRVIRETAQLGGYRWGIPRKTALLAWEASRR